VSTVSHVVSGARRFASALLRGMRNHRDRWLHPSRHRRVEERLRHATRPRSIVVVCHGNICRSPYLAAVLHQALPDIEISSAGLVGPGRPVPDHSETVATRRGLDLSSHRSRLLSWEILRRADLVIVMDAKQERYVTHSLRFPADRVLIAGDLDPVAEGPRAIRDPWNQSLEVFEASFARLDRCAESLARILSRG
jgi:protein-tyrosine phosphatase